MLIQKMTTVGTTWAALKSAADDGSIRNLIDSGDKIPLTLKNGENITVDATYDENGNLFFVIHDCMEDEHAMSKKASTVVCWACSEMRNYLNQTVFDLLPDDLQAVIKPTTISQVVNNETIVTEDKLFLLSRTQVYGRGLWSTKEPGDTQLDIFRTGRDRVKMLPENGTCSWWLRYMSTSGYFANVCASGGYSYTKASSPCGVAFGFSI